MARSLVISSGHGKIVRGAKGYIDEVDQARRVVNRVAEILRESGANPAIFHDDVSKTKSENLERIVAYHNARKRDLDVSVHFNAFKTTPNPMGTECLYLTQNIIATAVAREIAKAATLINRGPKKRTDLYFLNKCQKPAILIEVAFCDSKADSDLYEKNFERVCAAIASTTAGQALTPLPPEPEPTEPEDRPTVRKGSRGPAVVSVQNSLGVYPADGDFGSITDNAVRGFQAAAGLGVDGVVGPMTWDGLDELDARVAAGSNGLDQNTIDAITQVAETSAIAQYNWRDRGRAPYGYTAGIACCYGLMLKMLETGDESVAEMAQKSRGNPDEDALTWYAAEFAGAGMDNSKDSVDTLRHLWVMILGLGMRESSGRYSEGRDQSASNVQSNTAEAAFAQTSWDINPASDDIPPLLPAYWEDPNGFLEVFQKGVTLKSSDLGNFGSGDGARYQFLAKFCPAFHAQVTALGMRYRRKHWGPINNKAVEIRRDADTMLKEVETIIAGGVPEPGPEPEPSDEVVANVTIEPHGGAKVAVIGGASPDDPTDPSIVTTFTITVDPPGSAIVNVSGAAEV